MFKMCLKEFVLEKPKTAKIVQERMSERKNEREIEKGSVIRPHLPHTCVYECQSIVGMDSVVGSPLADSHVTVQSMIKRALLLAEIPSKLEPTWMLPQNERRPEYANLACFVSVAVDTLGALGAGAVEILHELGRRITASIGERRAT